MPATAIELRGRTAHASEHSSRARPWFVKDAADEAEAIATVSAAAPATLDGMVLRQVEIDEEIEGGFRCLAQYGMFQRKEPYAKGESQFNFEISLQPVRIVVPLEAQDVYARAGDTTPSDIDKWLIGDQGIGEGPEGAEIFEPAVAFSETHYIDEATLGQAQRVAMLRTVGKTNNAPFKGWAAGEVLCAGISGAKRGVDDWEVTFRFQARDNQTGLEIAGITGIDKEGWEYLWPRYQKVVDGGSFTTSNHIRYIVVAKVFNSADFSALGIGT